MTADVFESVKAFVSMPEAAEMYGYPPDSHGFVRCPFHNERTASFKCYPDSKGFYCFGCQASGDVIDFVSRLFDVERVEAVKKLNEDFSLGLPVDRPMNSKERRAVQDRKVRIALERELKRRKDRLIDKLTECIHMAADALEKPPEQWTKQEETAICVQDELDYLWDEIFRHDSTEYIFIRPCGIFGVSRGVEAERLCKEILGA